MKKLTSGILVLLLALCSARAFGNSAVNDDADTNLEALYSQALKLLDSSNRNYDEVDGIKLLKQLANLEYAPAMNDLGLHYQTGTGMIFKRPRTGFKWLLKSAEKNYIPALFNVAEAYESGTGTQVNLEKSKVFFNKVTTFTPDSEDSEEDLNFYYNIIAEAHTRLGLQALEEKNHKEALAHFVHASELEQINGQLQAARLHALGLGTIRDLEKAQSYIDSASRNISRRIRRIANIYFSESLIGNTETGILQKEADQEARNLVQQMRVLIGQQLAESEELPVPEEAVKWFRLAAEDGNAYAAAQLGRIFLEGRDDLVEEDEARTFLQTAEKEGLWLGFHLSAVLKMKIDNDPVAANALFQRAADRGYYVSFLALKDPTYARPIGLQGNIDLATNAAKAGDRDAAFYYGLYIWLNLIEGQPQESAVSWFKKADKGGNINGTYYYGLSYYTGVAPMPLTQSRLSRAIKLFESASKRNHALSHYLLGVIYENSGFFYRSQAIEHYEEAYKLDPSTWATVRLGDLLVKGAPILYIGGGKPPQWTNSSGDFDRGIKLLQVAADHNHSEAYKLIGDIYKNGNSSIKKDLEAAREWYEKAVKIDENPNALYALAILAEGTAEPRTKESASIALTFYERAANKGHIDAITVVAKAYYVGLYADFRPNVSARFFGLLVQNGRNKYADEYCNALIDSGDFYSLAEFLKSDQLNSDAENFYAGYLKYYGLANTRQSTSGGLKKILRSAKMGFYKAEVFVFEHADEFRLISDLSEIWKGINAQSDPQSYYWKGRIALERPAEFHLNNPVKMIITAAEKGCVPAMCYLNELRVGNKDGSPSIEKIKEWLTPYAENGVEAAIDCLESIEVEQHENEKDTPSLSSSYEDQLA